MSTSTRNLLTAELDGFIRAQIATGRYANPIEVARAPLRPLIERQPRRGSVLEVKAANAAKPIH